MIRVNAEDYTVTQETFDSIRAHWMDPRQSLKWNCLFVLPGWLKVWWDHFAGNQAVCLCAVRHGNKLIGIAPLMVQGKTARFMGDPDLCDFVDVIAAPVAPTTAFPIGQHNEDPLAMYLEDVFTLPANLAGVPGLSFPVGFDAEGLPVGMQLIAREFDEAALIRAGYSYQCATEWHKVIPSLE